MWKLENIKTKCQVQVVRQTHLSRRYQKFIDIINLYRAHEIHGFEHVKLLNKI